MREVKQIPNNLVCVDKHSRFSLPILKQYEMIMDV